MSSPWGEETGEGGRKTNWILGANGDAVGGCKGRAGSPLLAAVRKEHVRSPRRRARSPTKTGAAGGDCLLMNHGNDLQLVSVGHSVGRVRSAHRHLREARFARRG